MLIRNPSNSPSSSSSSMAPPSTPAAIATSAPATTPAAVPSAPIPNLAPAASGGAIPSAPAAAAPPPLLPSPRNATPGALSLLMNTPGALSPTSISIALPMRHLLLTILVLDASLATLLSTTSTLRSHSDASKSSLRYVNLSARCSLHSLCM